ncbi:MAG: hypothetical protein EB103_02065 [Actinobacteria bacterium]|nr:hypothetical protein [Actinomycetota bacterium]
MVQKRNLLIGLVRIAMAVTLLYAVYWQISDRLSHNVFRPAEYFSYFTITSCILSGIVLLVAGLGVLRNKSEGKWLTIARLTMAASMIIVGVIYNLLLANEKPNPLDAGYDWPVVPNLIMHTYMPIIIFLEWLITNTAFKLKLKQAFWVLIYPLSWLAFSLIRGSITGWWPYWFIDPASGLPTVVQWIATISAFFVVLALVLTPLQQALARSYRRQ